eukprot:TRINITY_DN13457_c0_g1_i1.p1 TRINITY_DN13457_c0_g1~~TRINITY_DN13457_c0_g1_i1.p1  ORF type:complete len:342 (-),score=46.18 TRINITY_DN13457_c0_g1_i1:115-1101(-)
MAGWNSFIAASSGSSSAAFSTIVLYPLDVIKAHCNKGIDAKGVKYNGPVDVGLRIFAHSGLRGFFEGMGARTSQQAVQKFSFYYCYDAFRTLFQKLLGTSQISFRINVLIGYVAGLSTVLVASPLEVVSTRQQLASEADVSKKLGTLRMLARMIRTEGIFVLWKGWTANAVLALNPAIENTVFDQVKIIFLKRVKKSSLTIGQAFWLGALSKIIATAMTFPLIRAKVIMQASCGKTQDSKNGLVIPTNGVAGAFSGMQPSEVPGHDDVGLTAVQVMRDIVAEDGPLALWKGMTPQATKAVLSSAVAFAAKERIDVATRAVIMSFHRAR